MLGVYEDTNRPQGREEFREEAKSYKYYLVLSNENKMLIRNAMHLTIAPHKQNNTDHDCKESAPYLYIVTKFNEFMN